MKICWLDFFTESARERDRAEIVAGYWRDAGHQVVDRIEPHCDVAFAGSIEKQALARQAWKMMPGVPLIFYNWDLYSFIWTTQNHGHENWRKFGRMLRRSKAVWCPSQCTVERTREYYDVASRVIKSWAWTYDDVDVSNGGYVVNVMRRYPDPNATLADEVCAETGIRCVSPDHRLPLREWRELVAGARFLICAYCEASTGGLSLLEGHSLGKPVLLSDSPWNGGVDYFGDRASYFRHDSRTAFWAKLVEMWENPPQHDRDECRQWVAANYSPPVIAAQMLAGFKEVAGQC